MAKKIIWGQLPEDAQAMLKGAAAITVNSSNKDVITRHRAQRIDVVVKDIKARYPEYFHKESM